MNEETKPVVTITINITDDGVADIRFNRGEPEVIGVALLTTAHSVFANNTGHDDIAARIENTINYFYDKRKIQK